ncbi:MAG: sulfite exporter TauE/SafE family protein [Acidobacteriota bacterium]
MPILVTPAIVVIVMAAGTVAGCLGALLGLGGGVFLVPFLNAALGLDFKVAAAISLVTVIATSSAVAAGTTGKNLINLRLGMLLEMASAAGGVAAAMTVTRISDVALERGFAAVAVIVAAIMLTQLERQNVIRDPNVDPGPLGGRYYDKESGAEVVYRVRRLPAALGVSFLAGNVSAAFGIGGGILKVPVLNAWCGVPMRAAAATSSLMIGVTAVASVPIQYANGYANPPLAAAAVLGVLVGSRAGLWFGGRTRSKWLKLLMAVVLLLVAVIYLKRSL